MAAVTLHIYDVTGHAAVQGVNKVLQPLGTGAFHGAVEVYGQEWSFGFCEEGTGVFPCPPKGCDMHAYREAVPMGETALSEREVAELLDTMSKEWAGRDYDLLRRNCCNFSDALCVRLGVGNVPTWVTNLAGAGATLQDGFHVASSKAQGAAIIAAAKAGEIDGKYQISSKTEAKAREISELLMALDAKHSISATAESKIKDAVSAVEALDAKHGISATADAKAKELDAKYGISDTAGAAAGKAQVAAAAAAGKATALFGKLAAPKK